MPIADLRARYQLTLPTEVRAALHVVPGDRIDFQIGADGEVRVRGLKTIPADQAWFWTKEWQDGEREVDQELAAGLGVTFHSGEEMDAWLDAQVAKD